MSAKEWTSTSVLKFFKINTKSKQTLFNAEKKKEIPQSKRIARGSTKVRIWETEQIPEIGKKFGFIRKPKKQVRLSFYMSKGGVLKTSVSHEFARVLALNGLNVLVIGLDIQCSITDILLPPIQTESLEEGLERPLGLYHFLFEKAPLEDVIKHTDIPTLDVIPETPDLNALEKKLRDVTKRESYFSKKLIPKLKKYDVIIFDNSPSWNLLIENALTTATTLISPIGCDIGTYQALQTNLENLYAFWHEMEKKTPEFYLVPTMLEKTKLSQQIYGSYITQHPDELIATPIRRAVTGQEAALAGQSVIEYDPSSVLASDYYELINQVWDKVCPIENKSITNKNKHIVEEVA